MEMREHLEKIDAEVQRCVMGLSDDEVYALRRAVADAIAACDDDGCEWTRIGGDGPWHPSCLGDHPHVSWSAWSREQMTMCPHCGRKIVLPLPPKEA